MTRRTIFVFVVGIPVVIVGTGVSVGLTFGLEQAFLPSLTAALVYVTAAYAYFTWRSVSLAEQTLNVANRQAEIMLNAEFNAAAPIVKLFASEKEQQNITVDWENVGKGPALNLRCWIQDDEHPELYKKEITRIVIVEKEPGRDIISTDIKGYTLGVGYLRAQYASIFGKTYESCLVFSTNAQPEFKYGQVEQDAVSGPNSGRTSEDNETQLNRIESAIQGIALSAPRLVFISIGFAMIIASVSIATDLIDQAFLPITEPWVRLSIFLGGVIVVILSSYRRN